MLYICTKFCQSISYDFRVTDLNSRVDARVVANVDGGTYGRTDRRTDGKSDPYIAPCLRQARQKGVFKSKQYFLYHCIKYQYMIELLGF